jgi:hypothetical protein
MEKNLNFLSLNPQGLSGTLDKIKDYFKTYFKASSFIYKSTLNKNIPIANTVLFFSKDTRVFEGGSIIPVSVYGNEHYFNKNRLPKKARLHKWIADNLKSSNTYSNFFHIVLECGNYNQKPSQLENNIKVLNTAFNIFNRNFKNNFPVKGYVSTIETSSNGLSHIHFIVQLEKTMPLSMDKNQNPNKKKGCYLIPPYEVKNKINKLWNNAAKKAYEKLCIEKRLFIKAFISGIHDSHIIDYITKQWIPINRLVLKDNAQLTDNEKAAIFTHFFCKQNSIRQVRNSDNIDKIKLPTDDSSQNADLLLVLHDKYFNPNNHYFIKMFLTLDFYKNKGLTLEDFPVALYKFALKTSKKPLLKPPTALKSLVNQYFRAFNLIIENGLENEYWFNKVYTIEDLITISFDGDLFFIRETE